MFKVHCLILTYTFDIVKNKMSYMIPLCIAGSRRTAAQHTHVGVPVDNGGRQRCALRDVWYDRVRRHDTGRGVHQSVQKSGIHQRELRAGQTETASRQQLHNQRSAQAADNQGLVHSAAQHARTE